MRPRNTQHEGDLINAFRQHKVLTIVQISSLLCCSMATVKRRLTEWKVLSSYNHSGRYYTLPSIPQFNKKGLWQYQRALFSKHGTLKNTVIHLVRLSPKGLSNSELQQILGLDPHSSLAQCKQLPGVRRENHKRPVVYFSADDEVYRQQQHTRYPPQPTTPRLSPDALTIIILVALIQHPSSTAEELSEMLKREGLVVDQPMIEELLAHHGLMKKKLNTPE